MINRNLIKIVWRKILRTQTYSVAIIFLVFSIYTFINKAMHSCLCWMDLFTELNAWVKLLFSVYSSCKCISWPTFKSRIDLAVDRLRRNRMLSWEWAKVCLCFWLKEFWINSLSEIKLQNNTTEDYKEKLIN